MKNKNKPSVRNAVFWNTASKFLQEGIRFVIAIILARLIEPSQFGVIAMVIVFISIGNRLTEGGLRSAIINKKDLDETDCTTALVANIILALIMSLILTLSSPFIASFYEEPILIYVVPVLALGLLFDASSIVQAALFTKKLEFKQQAIAGFVSAILSGIVGIAMALNDYGLWALVVSGLMGKAINSLVLWMLSNWLPHTKPTMTSFKRLFGYSSKIAISGLIENLSNNLLPLMIGKFYGAASLGFYNRANSFKEIPTNNIYLITQPIIFSKLSSQQNNPKKFNETFRKTTRMLAFIIFPLMIFLMIIAKSLVIALIGEKWLPSVILLQILCSIGIFHQMMRINNDAIISKGLAGLALKQEIIRKILYILAIFICFSFSLEVMLYGLVIHALVCYLIMVIVSDKFIGLSAINQFKDAFPYLLISLLSGLPLIFMYSYMDINLYNGLILSGILYSILYFILNLISNTVGFNDFFTLVVKKNFKFFSKK